MSTRRLVFRKVVFGAAVLAIIATALVVRVAIGSRAAFVAGEGHEAAGAPELAVLSYHESLSWYFPWNPWAARSVERLWDLATAFQDKGDLVAARTAVGELRGALYGIRHVTQPHDQVVRMCDTRLAALLAATDERVLAAETGPEELLPGYLKATRRDHAPSVGWSLALVVGFLLWIGCFAAGLWVLVPAEDAAPPSEPAAPAPLAWRRAWPLLTLSVTFLVVWLLGAALA